MRELAQLLNEMHRAGIILDYALFGATPRCAIPSPSRRLMPPSWSRWPTQFIPSFSPLTEEAMAQAVTADYEGTTIRVVSADHLAVIALSVGRAKDLTRVLSATVFQTRGNASRTGC